MNLAAVRDRFDAERRDVAPDGVRLEVLPRVTRAHGQDGGWQMIAWSALDEATADAEIAAQLAHYAALGAEFEWKVFAHDRPADLRQRLARHGFAVGPLEAVLVLDLAERPAWIAAGSEHRVIRVQSSAELELYRRAAEAIFPDHADATLRELRAGLDSGSTDQLGFVALADGVPVSVGRLYTNRRSQFAGLYGGGTRAEFRGQGYYRATVAARAQVAAALGARYLQVDALPTSRPILERLNFAHLTDTWPCVWSPPAQISRGGGDMSVG